MLQLLKGNVNEYITEKNLDKLKTFGVMSDHAESQILSHLEYFIKYGFINVEGNGVLSLTEKCKDVLFNGKRIRKMLPKVNKNLSSLEENDVDIRLLLKLKLLRKELAKKSGVPDFSVLTDAVLKNIAISKPKSIYELSKIQGMAEYKVKKYGPIVLHLINKHYS